MTTNIVQGDMDTLFTELKASDTGPYNPIGTDVGEFNVGMLGSDFEKNLAVLVGLVEFLVANTADPTNSTADALKAKYQKKLLKELLNHASARMKTVANYSSDDRVSFTDALMTKVITYYNTNTTSESL